MILGVHGAGGYKENNWGKFPLENYSLSAREYRAGRAFLAIDLPGFGPSAMAEGENYSTITLEEEFQTVAEISHLMRKGTYAGSPGPMDQIVGVGHSMGGLIVAMAQGQEGAEFDAIAVTGWSMSATSDRFNQCQAVDCGEDPFFWGPAMDPVIYDWMNRTSSAAGAGTTFHQTYVYALLPASQHPATRTQLASIHVPVLYIIGDHDWVFSYQDPESDYYPGAAFTQFTAPDTGHFVWHHQKRVLVQNAFDDWLTGAGIA